LYGDGVDDIDDGGDDDDDCYEDDDGYGYNGCDGDVDGDVDGDAGGYDDGDGYTDVMVMGVLIVMLVVSWRVWC